MAKRENILLEVWLRKVEEAAASLAADLERERYEEEPQSEAYDVECGCKELLDYINNYRTECDARFAAAAEDETVELRHLQSEFV